MVAIKLVEPPPYGELTMNKCRESVLREQGVAETQHRHAEESKEHTQVMVVIKTQAFDKELQSNTDHDARSKCEKAPVHNSARRDVGTVSELEPQGGNSCAKGLGQATKESRPGHGPPAGTKSHIQRQSHGEALRDVVDEQGHKNVEAQSRVDVVRSVGDEALWELVEGNGYGRLQSNRKKGVGWNVVMMLGFGIALVHLRAWIAVFADAFVRQGRGVARRYSARANAYVMNISIAVIVSGVE